MIDGKPYFTLHDETACLIDDFSDYAITTTGKVYSIRYKRFIKPQLNSNGYLQVGLFKDNKRIKKLLHRLLAEHFITNPDNLPQVDHINRVRSDYSLSNLRWVSIQGNSSNRGILYCCSECGRHKMM
ncbi:HNH endonuclease [Hymenobacter sublimis]|uniref:HNH endonuclease n=1 Tax=Hymenobacter sublimis TaxID=2933777 RepID=UPI0035CA4309